MNWDALDFDWNRVRAFLATAEEGSLSAAARVLRSSQPTVGRQVAALEQDLGVTLFERRGNRLILTPTGADLLSHMREMGEAAIRLSRAASGRTQAVDGLVRISATDLVAAWLLPGTLPGLHAAHPGIQIDIVAANDLSDLQRRVADIAIRHVRPTEPELVARLLGETPVHLYASSGYLDRVGRNPDPGAIDVIGFDGATAMVELLSAQGLTVEPRAVWLTSRSGLVGWAMARRGLGATIMAERIAERTPGMERIDIDLGYDPVPFWLVTHREVHTSRRVRIVYDHLAQTWPWAEGS